MKQKKVYLALLSLLINTLPTSTQCMATKLRNFFTKAKQASVSPALYSGSSRALLTTAAKKPQQLNTIGSLFSPALKRRFSTATAQEQLQFIKTVSQKLNTLKELLKKGAVLSLTGAVSGMLGYSIAQTERSAQVKKEYDLLIKKIEELNALIVAASQKKEPASSTVTTKLLEIQQLLENPKLLIDMIESNNYQAVQIMLQLGVNANVTNEQGQSPLQIAYNQLDKRIAILLAKEGIGTTQNIIADIINKYNETDNNEMKKEYYTLLEHLLIHNKNVINKYTNNETTLLHNAVNKLNNNDDRLVALLIANGADSNLSDKKTHATPLLTAALNNNSNAVRALLNAPNVDLYFYFGDKKQHLLEILKSQEFVNQTNYDDVRKEIEAHDTNLKNKTATITPSEDVPWTSWLWRKIWGT